MMGKFGYIHSGRFWIVDEGSFSFWYNKEFKNNPYGRQAWKRDIFENIDTPEKAYWLGFITADGCLNETNNRVSIDIGGEDKEHLIHFINFIQGDIKLLKTTVHPQTKNELCHVSLCGKENYNNLTRLGLCPKKSGKEKYIHTHFDRDYIRGLIDGDGCIRSNLSGIELVGSYDLLYEVQQKFKTELGINPHKIMTHGVIYKIAYCSKKDIYTIINWLYKDASVSLLRKQKLANIILNEKIC